MAKKILLCGNGINLQLFGQDFAFSQFLEILKDSQKLQNEINNIISIDEYKKWKEYSQEFIEITESCKDRLDNLDEKAKNNGVEAAILEFQDEVDSLLCQTESSLGEGQGFKTFSSFFNILFFNYLYKIEKEVKFSLLSNKNLDWVKFKKNIGKKYSFIYTLNYDTLLELIFSDKRVKYFHGKILIINNKIDFSKTILENYWNSKWLIASKTNFPIFLHGNRLIYKYELDIVGINPINDEHIFYLFILSKICKKITFYYYSKEDITNYKSILEKFIKYEFKLNKNNTKAWIETKSFRSNPDPMDELEIKKINDEEYEIKFFEFEIDQYGEIKPVETKTSIHLKKVEKFWDEFDIKIKKNDSIIKNLENINQDKIEIKHNILNNSNKRLKSLKNIEKNLKILKEGK